MDSCSRTRRFWLRACTAGALSPFVSRGFAADSLPVIPGVHRVFGDVSVNGKPAYKGLLVQPGDEIVTGSRSEAVFVIGQDAFLLRDSSVVRFGAASATTFMRIVTGKILSVFGRGEKSIAVSTAVIGIRGTGCYIEESGKQTYFCLCYGEAEIVPLVSPKDREIIRTTHHDHPIYINADSAMPTSMVPAEVVNHSDAELTFLESLVGRTPSFTASQY
ncbi:FecR domain-containing protein [Propionivibrio dicarboxylicus]|uniref:FecR family protein n=1 Tax=Propionivibrio dicarboxylicus TaxID=83767 RepID=A0A1G8H1H6_9RHOO|nr:FecR domain-containing protein [Propionivibrio dicarboxylicus]SDI00350.1 hypothetical protein SAMN05660652_02705 [Propionivibrio dicarboxylicus]